MFKKLILVFALTGCTASKPSNEISDMALECFKNHQSITIIFEPHPEGKSSEHAEMKESEETSKEKAPRPSVVQINPSK